MSDSNNNLSSDSNNNNNYSSNFEELYEDVENTGSKSISSNFYENSTVSSFKSEEMGSSTSIIQGTTSNTLENNILLKIIIFGNIYCSKCMKPCLIIFNNNFTISFDCECSFIKNFSVKEFINDYLHKGKNELSENEYTLHCKFHYNQTKFIKYCSVCGYDLCEECMNDKYLLNSQSETGKIVTNKKHENHTLINLDDVIKKFKDVEELINSIEKKMEFYDFDKNEVEQVQNIFSVIKCVMETYQTYKCYNSYKSIINAEKFLKKILSPEYSFNFGKKVKKKYIRLIKVTSEKEFSKNIINFSKILRIINIKDTDLHKELFLFKDKKFYNLTELVLVKDKCSDISPLLSCEFPSLEKLDLEDNSIDNIIIDLLEKVKFPKLIYLNLYSNKITSLKLFELIKNFTKLENFFAGENKFELDNNPKDFYEFPESLIEFGMTGNLEGEKIEFNKRLGISNLLIFYVSRNKIDNFNFLKDIHFKRLEEFWSIRNQITDINEIMKIDSKKNLKIINLKENPIKNFNELINIINNFPELNKLNLIDCGITRNEILEMNKKIKEKHNLDIEILV